MVVVLSNGSRLNCRKCAVFGVIVSLGLNVGDFVWELINATKWMEISRSKRRWVVKFFCMS